MRGLKLEGGQVWDQAEGAREMPRQEPTEKESMDLRRRFTLEDKTGAHAHDADVGIFHFELVEHRFDFGLVARVGARLDAGR